MTPASSPSRPSSRGGDRSSLDGRDDAAVQDLCHALEQGASIQRSLVGGGRLHIERPLPFVVLYRPPGNQEDPGTAELVASQPSHLIAASGKGKATAALLRAIVTTMRQKFGAMLLVEVCSLPADSAAEPTFVVAAAENDVMDDVVDVLERALGGLKLQGAPLVVDSSSPATAALRRTLLRRTLLPKEAANALVCHRLVIGVRPIYRDPEGQVYPAVVRQLRAGLSRALGRTFYRFSTEHTGFQPPDFHSLGRRVMVRAVWQVDERLAEVSRSFDLLISINPVGVDLLWSEFRRSNFEKLPKMRYRSLTVDPVLMKRRLYAVPLEKIEDPTLSHLFYEKQAELDKQLGMLLDRGTSRFLHGSMQLFGPVSSALLRTAESILERVPAGMRVGPSGGTLRAPEVLKLARAELQGYAKKWGGFEASVRLSKDVLAGMMCSRGELLVSADTRTPATRVDALMQHEVGTHLVTYYNGGAQRFQHLQVGLAGYEELQEGLAVFAEYASGGMTPARLRILAARVVAADMVMAGASFVDVFRALCRFGFARRTSFGVALRLFRGGGYTKDLIYLRGLVQLLRYLEKDGPIAPLFVGKVAMAHVPLVRELTSRKILKKPPLLPSYLERPDSKIRIARARSGMDLHQMLERGDDGAGDRGSRPSGHGRGAR